MTWPNRVVDLMHIYIYIHVNACESERLRLSIRFWFFFFISQTSTRRSRRPDKTCCSKKVTWDDASTPACPSSPKCWTKTKVSDVRLCLICRYLFVLFCFPREKRFIYYSNRPERVLCFSDGISTDAVINPLDELCPLGEYVDPSTMYILNGMYTRTAACFIIISSARVWKNIKKQKRLISISNPKPAIEINSRARPSCFSSA